MSFHYPCYEIITLYALTQGVVDGWMDGWVGGWVDGLLGGWMGGWVDESLSGNDRLTCWRLRKCTNVASRGVEAFPRGVEAFPRGVGASSPRGRTGATRILGPGAHGDIRSVWFAGVGGSSLGPWRPRLLWAGGPD
ncbi:MAG: hypothetical protein EOM91_19045, partial [Sphingobacteriia bacterium]|nr:hypothetical protein [Sphingobacteriia bacterium]NCC41440.1 hypothetical protein [Gammaproteobacteria bacterium]